MNSSGAAQTRELLALAHEGHVAAFVDRACGLPPVDLADVLAVLPPKERDAIVVALPPAVAAPALAELARAGRAEAASAASLMTVRMVTVQELEPIGLAVESVRRQAAGIGDLTEIFVVDAARRLTGVLSLRQLLLATPSVLVRDAMARNAIHVGPDEQQQVVARVIARYDLTSVPVVDKGGHLLGRVTADDVRGVTITEATGDLLRFGGVSKREPPALSWNAAVRSRLPSLYTNLLAAFAAAAVVYFFRSSIVRVVSLAVWMPVVAGVGGNAGTQALAASVRRLVLNPDRSRGLRGLVVREAGVGAANGLAIGVVVAGVAVLLGESWKFGLVVLLAMVGNLLLAGVIGATMPTLLRRAGRDPALASPVFVTALMDACGFALLLGLGSVVLL